MLKYYALSQHVSFDILLQPVQPLYEMTGPNMTEWKLTCHCVEVVDEGNHKNGLGSQQTRNQGDIDPDIEHS